MGDSAMPSSIAEFLPTKVFCGPGGPSNFDPYVRARIGVANHTGSRQTKPNKGGGSRQEAGGTAGPGPGGNLMPQAEGAPDFLVGMSERQVFEVLVQFKVRLAFASLSWLH